MEVPNILIVSVIMILITNPFRYLKLQLIEQVYSNDLDNIEDVLRDREKYWQPQLFTIAKVMNSILDLYASKRKGCRKR